MCNKAEGRENVVVGGHFRLKVAKDLELKEMPVVCEYTGDRTKRIKHSFEQESRRI